MTLDITLLGILTGFISIGLGVYVFLANPRRGINWSLALYSILAGVWAFALYLYVNPLWFDSEFWIRAVYLTVIIFLIPILHLNYHFPSSDDYSKRFLPHLIIYMLLSAPFVWILFGTPLWVESVLRGSYGPETVLGPAYSWWGVFMGVNAAFLFYPLWVRWKKTKGIEKAQIRFFTLGLFSMAVGTMFLDIVLPLVLGDTRFFWASSLFSLTFSTATAYAIVKHRFMDIRSALGRGAVYVFSFLTVLAFASSLTLASNNYLGPASFNLAGPLILVVSILLFQPTFRFFEKVASQYFYYSLYSSQAVLTGLGEKLTRVLDLDKLAALLASTLVNTMKLDRVVVLLREAGNGDYRIQRNIGFKEENGIALVKDNFLTAWLEKTQRPVAYEELSLIIRDTIKEEEKKRLEELQSTMKRIEAVLCLPLLFERKIIGMIVLGNKISGDSYSQQDVELLVSLANQASIALQNAKLYFEIKGFSATLEKTVEERTRELRELAGKLEEANVQVQSVEKMKSDLLNMASHEFRTPLGIVKNAVWFLNKDDEKTRLSEKGRQNMERLDGAVERFDYLLANMQKMLETTAGDFTLDLSPVQLEILIKEVLDGKELEAQEKQVSLAFHEPQELLPSLNADANKLKYVLWELLNNALKYTSAGGSVTIEARRKDNAVEVSVADTGAGIHPEKLNSLFDGFAKIDVLHTSQSGMGLGLYLVKKIVELHQGAVDISSAIGKGTKVTITLLLEEK